MAITISIISILISLYALIGAALRTGRLQQQMHELKSKSPVFNKSFFEKWEDQVLPGSPPEATIMVDEEIRKRLTKKRVTENTTTTETRND